MKTPEQYKEDFIKRASTGFLLKIWRARWDYCKDPQGDWLPNDCVTFENGVSCKDIAVTAKDIIWSREAGGAKLHTWTGAEFKAILDARPHYKNKFEANRKRKLLAYKYKNGRKGH